MDSQIIERALDIIRRYDQQDSDEKKKFVEALKLVVRAKKARLKLKCPPGTKQKGSVCVPKSGAETVSRRIGSKKGKVKRFAQSARSAKRRKRSMMIRKGRGL